MDIDNYKALLKQREELQKQIDRIEEEYFNAKLYRFTAYVVDVNRDYEDLESMIADLESRTDISLHVVDSAEADLLWHDEIDINFSNCPTEAYEAYFKQEGVNP